MRLQVAGSVGTAGVEGVEHGFEFEADGAEGFDGLYFPRYAGMVLSYLMFGGFQFHPFIFDKECYDAYLLDIFGGVKTCATVVAVWLYDGEFVFIVTQCGCR